MEILSAKRALGQKSMYPRTSRKFKSLIILDSSSLIRPAGHVSEYIYMLTINTILPSAFLEITKNLLKLLERQSSVFN